MVHVKYTTTMGIFAIFMDRVLCKSSYADIRFKGEHKRDVYVTPLLAPGAIFTDIVHMRLKHE